jgi:hypothetical protein
MKRYTVALQRARHFQLQEFQFTRFFSRAGALRMQTTTDERLLEESVRRTRKTMALESLPEEKQHGFVRTDLVILVVKADPIL